MTRVEKNGKCIKLVCTRDQEPLVETAAFIRSTHSLIVSAAQTDMKQPAIRNIFSSGN